MYPENSGIYSIEEGLFANSIPWFSSFPWFLWFSLGMRLRGRTTTCASKKGSEKCSGKGSGKGSLRGVLRRWLAVGLEYHWSKNHYTHTTFIVGELLSQLRARTHTHTHISYTTLIVEEFICVMRVYLCCLVILPLLYQKGDLHNNNARGISISNATHTSYIRNNNS